MSTQFSLNITLGNDAMRTRQHLATALRQVAKRMMEGAAAPETGKIMDVNGNSVGQWIFTDLKG